MTKEEVRKDLFSKKSAKRRKAAQEINKQKLQDLDEDLFIAYSKEKKDRRTWETQVSMILALGVINCQSALTDIETIVSLNLSHDMITWAAAQAWVRLKRKSLNDAKPVIELLKIGGLCLVDGATRPLSYDKMMPPKDEITELISLCWDLHKHKDRIGSEYGYSDPRYGIAAACAGWDKQLVKDFLNHCMATGDDMLKIVAADAFKGKYVKSRV